MVKIYNKNDHKKAVLVMAVIRWIGSPTSLIVHTMLFLSATFILAMGWFSFEAVMLIWNTVVSLEAIYLAILIQMTVNLQAAQLDEIAENIDEIQDDVGELQEDVVELTEAAEADELAEAAD